MAQAPRGLRETEPCSWFKRTRNGNCSGNGLCWKYHHAAALLFALSTGIHQIFLHASTEARLLIVKLIQGWCFQSAGSMVTVHCNFLVLRSPWMCLMQIQAVAKHVDSGGS